MILKVCSYEEVKKSIFFKTKPYIANPYDRKLDVVPYFAPLVTVGVKIQIEKQVRFSVDLPNVFFKLVREPNLKNGFSGQNFDF